MNFLTDEISSEFFEIGSEQRLSIILNLNEKVWSISALAKELEATITEVHRNFTRLQKAGLILKNIDGTYRLTVIGKNVCSHVASHQFLIENKKYFETHSFGDMPSKFQYRIGQLYKQKRIKGFVRVLEKWKEVHNNSSEYINNILTEVPYSKEIIDIVEEKLNKKIKIQTIFAENVIVPEERKTIFKIKKFNRFTKEELLLRRMIKKVSIVLLLNEKESCIIFPDQNGEPDMREMFSSEDPKFHEWCLDYFEYCWKNSSSFHESKMNVD